MVNGVGLGMDLVACCFMLIVLFFQVLLFYVVVVLSWFDLYWLYMCLDSLRIDAVLFVFAVVLLLVVLD